MSDTFVIVVGLFVMVCTVTVVVMLVDYLVAWWRGKK